MILKVVIADDEPNARSYLRGLLARDPDLNVVEECSEGRAAMAAIERHRPDLLFLDIEMPGLDGMVVGASTGGGRPALIFTTAYSEHAVEAFEIGAVDYLMKPFSSMRLETAVTRAKRHLSGVHAKQGEAAADGRILLRAGGRVILQVTAEIVRLESAGNYTEITASGKVLTVREPLSKMEENLAPSGFLRVHRSHLVNPAFVREVSMGGTAGTKLTLRDGSSVPVARGYRSALMERLAIK